MQELVNRLGIKSNFGSEIEIDNLTFEMNKTYIEIFQWMDEAKNSFDDSIDLLEKLKKNIKNN